MYQDKYPKVKKDTWHQVGLIYLIDQPQWRRCGNWLYIYRRDGVAMYVGKTTYSPYKRLKQHISQRSALGIAMWEMGIDPSFCCNPEFLWKGCNQAEVLRWDVFMSDVTRGLLQQEYKLIKHYQPEMNTHGK